MDSPLYRKGAARSGVQDPPRTAQSHLHQPPAHQTQVVAGDGVQRDHHPPVCVCAKGLQLKLVEWGQNLSCDVDVYT